MTRQLLAFSRKEVLDLRVLDLNAIIADLEKMLHRLIGEDIEVVTALRPGLWPVKADEGQMEQIILNLAVNARDAMPKGGKLTIETRNFFAELPAPMLSEMPPEMPPGRYVNLVVSDTGCGMAPETQARAFQPFFTTKEPGKGTGLGLATVYSIAKQCGGGIRLNSLVGHGTTFKIFLPCTDERRSSSKSLAGIFPIPGGSETILLAEDDDAIRKLVHLMLKKSGYTVLQARHGSEALPICEGHQGPIHLLVTDVVMPHLGGGELARRLLTLRPEIKVLYLSGYTDEAVVRHGVQSAETSFLQKPFSPDALIRKVREVLDGSKVPCPGA